MSKDLPKRTFFGTGGLVDLGLTGKSGFLLSECLRDEGLEIIKEILMISDLPERTFFGTGGLLIDDLGLTGKSGFLLNEC